jgi:hypothetical protein
MILALASDGADAGFAVHSKGIVYGLCASDSMPNNVPAADTASRPDEDAERVLVKTAHTR